MSFLSLFAPLIRAAWSMVRAMFRSPLFDMLGA